MRFEPSFNLTDATAVCKRFLRGRLREHPHGGDHTRVTILSPAFPPDGSLDAAGSASRAHRASRLLRWRLQNLRTRTRILAVPAVDHLGTPASGNRMTGIFVKVVPIARRYSHGASPRRGDMIGRLRDESFRTTTGPLHIDVFWTRRVPLFRPLSQGLWLRCLRRTMADRVRCSQPGWTNLRL